MIEDAKNQVVLVTGGTGSIGAEIVKKLLKSDVKQIIVFSRDEIKQFYLDKEVQSDKLITYIGDIRDIQSLERLFSSYKITQVFHAAAMKHVVVVEKHPFESVLTNLVGTQNLCDVAKKYGITRFITISTDKAVNPSNVMGATKFIAERITLKAGYTCVRFGNVANSRGSVIPVMIKSLVKDKKITVSDPNITRFIMKISDAVDLVLKAASITKGGEIYILKMKAVRLGDLAKLIHKKVAPMLNLSPEEIEVNELGLTTGEKLHEELLNVEEMHHISEVEDMYVIKPASYFFDEQVSQKYYSSDRADKISEEDLLDIIKNYLDNNNQICSEF